MAAHVTSLNDTEIREMTPDDDLDALFDLGARAFGPSSVTDPAVRRAQLAPQIEAGRIVCAFQGGTMVASARYHDLRQWWHGRSQPMAGVAAVMVAPEHRGQGVGRALMRSLLDVIAGRGYPLSVLFPATTPLYRSLGWEMAGEFQVTTIPARSLRAFVPPDVTANERGTLADDPAPGPHAGRFRRATAGDAAGVLAVLGRIYETSRDQGPATREEAVLAYRLSDPGLYAYLAADGFLAYRWRGGNDELAVDYAAAVSERTTRELWSIVASHSSIASTVRARLGPADPLSWLAREPDAGTGFRERWMLRVVDAPAAVAARGFPASAQLSVPLWITDDAREGNAGLWELSVTGGRGTLVPSPEATRPLTIGARGLAALYAGTPMAVLRRAGLAAGGDPVADSELDGAFAGAAWMTESF